MEVSFYPFSLFTTLVLPSMAFVCETCGKSFLTSEKLWFHRVVHGVENMKCHICDKICIGKKAFNNHIKTHQTYECSVCKERIHKFKISRKIGTPVHKELALKSLVWHNSKRAGYVSPGDFQLRKSSPRFWSSPMSSPRLK